MKTNEEIMAEFVEMMEAAVDCANEDYQLAPPEETSKLYCAYLELLDVTHTEQFKAIKERVEQSANNAHLNHYLSLDELKDKVDSKQTLLEWFGDLNIDTLSPQEIVQGVSEYIEDYL